MELCSSMIIFLMDLQLAEISQMRGALLAGCSFKGVDVGGVDFAGAEMAKASFAGAIASTPAKVAGANGLESFPLGTVDTVLPGSLVAVHGYLLCVTGDHPSNPAYAFCKSHQSLWAAGRLAGSFEKRHCRVLA